MAVNKGYLSSNKTVAGDEAYTPFYAVVPLIKYLRTSSYKTIWCPFDEEWSAYVQLLREQDFTVIRSSLSDGKDFFKYEPNEPYDIIISNPPFSKKNEVLQRVDDLGKPFALLLPMNSLQGAKRFDVFERGIQLLSFDQRIGFHNPEMMELPVEGNSFASAYFCRDFLPKDLIVERLYKYNRPLSDIKNSK